MRSGPATPTASHVDSCSALVTAGRRNDRLSPTAPQKECHICQSRLPIRDHATTNPQPLRWPAVRPGSKNRSGRRPQCPGNPFALARVSGMSPGDSPSRIAGCRWLCRNHSAGPGTPTFSLGHTLNSMLGACKQKTAAACAEAVDDETSLWTNVENCGELHAGVLSSANTGVTVTEPQRKSLGRHSHGRHEESATCTLATQEEHPLTRRLHWPITLWICCSRSRAS